ncbi:hypothetical protein [Glutamicibacter sp.]|uniref:hypothetical protein n=1 Tax=Glutamicibacter sp. TaxID=1931995 RepID=UPI0028BD6306|nr:hypothetical protein [Glutamicibacter sp.]
MIKTALTLMLAAGAAVLPVIQPVGDTAAGGADMASAPQLQPGSSQDSMPAESTRYYKLPTPAEGERQSVSAQLLIDPMLEPTSTDYVKFDVNLVQADGDNCDFGGSTATDRSGVDRLALASLDTGVYGPNQFTGCYSGGNQEVYLKVVRSGQWQADNEIPLQLTLVNEPAVDPTTLSGNAPSELPPANVDLDQPAAPVAGGSSFLSAAELGGTSVSSDQLLPLETKYYKVHLSEGQRLNYRVTMGDSRDASATTLVAQEFSPTLASGISTQSRSELDRDDVGASVTRSTSTTVSRDLFDASGSSGELRNPGYYYIALTGSARDPRGLNPMKYELAVQVTGDPAATAAWEPHLASESAANTSGDSWLPSTGQLGALIGGVAVGLAGFAALWLLRHRS